MIKTERHFWIFVIGWTAISASLSIVITFGIVQVPVSAATIVATVGSPLLIAPWIAIFTGRVMLNFHRMSQHLQRALERDHLTGVFNRRYLMKHLANLPADEEATLLMIDVDKFKAVNDAHGHLVGDAVLCRIAKVLSDNCRDGDYVARFGGEEFMLYLRGSDKEVAYVIAERMRQMIASQVVRADGVKIYVTISIGLGHRSKGADFDGVMKEADAALYHAKRVGRNQTVAA